MGYVDDATAETGVGAAIAIAALISVGLRFCARHYTHVGFRFDDWLVLASLIFFITTYIVVVIIGTIYPNGAYVASTRGIKYTPADVLYTRISFIATAFYFPITSTTKLPILLLYNRLFFIRKEFRRQIIVLFIAVIGYGLGTTIANLLNCIPLKYAWIDNLADPRFCFNYNIFCIATGITEAVLDLFIIIVPIEVKIAVGSVFLVGIIAIVSGFLKIGYGYIPNSHVPSFGKTAIWTTVHLGIGIICGCLLVCWPLLVHLGNFPGYGVSVVESAGKASAVGLGYGQETHNQIP
ncbi:hypothetical protein F4803DRAFT_560239 [Xylaria telfairii]|nr:hypothetical protein F4803DRAFT_560239 [Xylaria telfairii]